MTEEITTDSVVDAIAAIELQRQEMDKQAHPEAWRNLALSKLQEILLQLQEALQLHGPSAERLANADAVMTEINKVKARAGVASQRPTPNASQPRQPNGSWRDAHRQPARTRGRRTMGRRSAR